MNLQNIIFLQPIFLYITPLVLVIFIFVYFYGNKKNAIKTNFYEDLKKVYKNSSIFFYIKLFLILLILSFYLIIIADPNLVNSKEKIKKNGIDIEFILDVSKSMNADDLSPNRMEAAKNVIIGFVDRLKNDRVGLTIFAGKPFSSIPLTFDYNIVKEILEKTNSNSLNQNLNILNGTAIGDALLIAKNQFKIRENDSENREKVIILLTDGDTNKGINPVVAAKNLKDSNIKIYSIGIGSENGGYITYQDGVFKQKQKIEALKEDDLKEISNLTSGKYFRATDNKSLENIFLEIARLEKTDIEIEVKKSFKEIYLAFLYIILILVGVYYFIVLKN